MDFAERQRLFDKPIGQPKKTVEEIKANIKFLEYCIKTEGKLMGKNKS
jgi:hypothetical protein|tara:strand:- start:471 stop:614 length:144 start_codon:yes stop_codon:yes gene_type:complete